MNYFLTNQHYVYLFLRADSTPYYVGKGKNYRVWDKRRNSHAPVDLSRMIIIHCASEKEALDREIELIAQFGRKDLGTGILRNFTNGGEGTCGRKYITSDETKLKLRASRLGKPNPKNSRRHTPEQNEKNRRATLLQMKNNPHSNNPEVIEKCRQAALKQWSSGQGHSYGTAGGF